MDKKEFIASILLCVFLLLFVVVAILGLTNKDKQIVTEQPPVIDENTYISLSNVEDESYLTIYKKVNLKKVNFSNVPEVLTTSFYEKQDQFIKNINDKISSNKEYIDNYNKNNNITDYSVNSEIDSIIIYDLKDNILSLLYLIEDKVDYIGINNNISNIFIDVSNNSLVNNEMLLSKYNLTKNSICDAIFDNILNYHGDTFKNISNNKELTKEEVLTKKNDYVSQLAEKFDDYIYLYFNDGSLYLKYNRNDISNLLFDEGLDKTTFSTLKVNIN